MLAGSGATPNATVGTGAEHHLADGDRSCSRATRRHRRRRRARRPGVTATAGNGTATVSWTAPGQRRQPDHELHDHAVHRRARRSRRRPSPARRRPPRRRSPGSPTARPTRSRSPPPTRSAPARHHRLQRRDTHRRRPRRARRPASPRPPATRARRSRWTAPGNGGSPITSYTITPYIGAHGADRRRRSPARHPRPRPRSPG